MMFSPFGVMNASFAGWRMLAEAQMVIAYRMMGMSGFTVAAPGENTRMVTEKSPAFAAANIAAWQKAMAGARPDEIASAWLRPIGARTRSNASRLSRTAGRRR